MIDELQLLSGNPINIGNCNIYPLKLGEIVQIGESNYNKYLSVLMINKSSVNREDINPEYWGEFLKMDDFEYLTLLMSQNKEIQDAILESLSLFLKESVKFNLNYGLFIQREDGIVLITKDIFNKIKDVISEQNFLKNSLKEEEKFNPYDDKARELIEKRNKFKKMLQEQHAEDGLNLSDIISIVSCHSNNINFFNIWDLTVYTLYVIYIRMAMKDQYETQIYLLPHSSENKSNELKHWMSKISKIN